MKQICPKCGKSEFMIADINITNSSYPFSSIQCTNCGNVLGIIPSEYTPQIVRDTKEEILSKLEAQGLLNEIKK